MTCTAPAPPASVAARAIAPPHLHQPSVPALTFPSGLPSDVLHHYTRRRSGCAGHSWFSNMHQSNPTSAFRDALKFAQGQVRRLIEAHPGFYPLYTDKGRWKHDKPAWTRWCDGFLPGMMWLLLESGAAEDASYWRSKAEHYSRQLEERKEDRDVHDLGFIFFHGTYKRWYEVTVREGKTDKS